jgi:hypothetical protein
LGNSVDRLFQLKVATATAGVGRQQLAHLIGIVHGTDGQCTVAVWEPQQRRLVTFEDNVFRMQYQGLGCLAFEHLGIKPD